MEERWEEEEVKEEQEEDEEKEEEREDEEEGGIRGKERGGEDNGGGVRGLGGGGEGVGRGEEEGEEGMRRRRWRRKRRSGRRRRWRRSRKRLKQRQSCERGTDRWRRGRMFGGTRNNRSPLPPSPLIPLSPPPPLCDRRPVRGTSCGDQELKICPSAAKRCSSPPSLRALLKTCCSTAVNYAILCPRFKMGTFWARRRGSSATPRPPPKTPPVAAMRQMGGNMAHLCPDRCGPPQR